MPAPENKGWSLRDFAQVLGTTGTQSSWIVVGGQAVNFWAGHYLSAEPELHAFRPFTSKDLDLVGNEDDVQELAKRLGRKPTRPRKSAASPIIALFVVETAAGRLVIEVLNGLANLTRREVESQAVVLSSALQPDVRVLNPIGCLLDKAGNLKRFDQRGRQDLQHVKILVLCTRGFLRESIHAATNGEIEPRKCIKVLEQVLKVSRSPAAIQAATKHGLDWNQLWPWDALRAANVEQIKRFLAYRLAPAH